MADPHEQGRVSRDHYYRKTEVRGRIFAILDWAVDDRGLNLMPHISRAVRRGDILELITTDEEGKRTGAIVDQIATIGFMEVTEAGLLLNGDMLSIDKEDIGEVIGFDETHMPNHLNVVIHVTHRRTGKESEIKLDATVKFSAIFEEETDKQMGF